MGAVVFPSNPNINDIHNHEGISWIWDGSSWSKLFKSWSFSDQNDYLYYNTDNVGIGTTSPDTILEVVGSDPILTIRDTDTSVTTVNAKLRLAETNPSDTLGNHWDIEYLTSDLNFSYNGSPFMHIDYQGKVGIGTTSPDELLHLEKLTDGVNEGNPGIVLENSDQKWAIFNRGSSSDRFQINDMTDPNATTAPFRIFPGAPTDSIHISSTGKVGIGVTNPVDKFEIEVDTDEALRIVNTAGTMRGYFGRKSSGEGHLGIFDASSVERIHLDTTAHSFFTGSGNVGIGTTSPDAPLTVMTNGDTSSDGIILRSSSTGGRTLRLWATGDKAFIGSGGGGEDLILNNAGGNVGINTTSPKTKLHLNHGETSVNGPQELLRLQGNWNGATGVDGDGALIRFTNQHDNATNPNTGEYNVAGIAGLDDSSNWGGSLHFQTSSTGGTGGNDLQTRMVVRYDGKVGIGTSSPAEKLEVSGAIKLGTTSSTNPGTIRYNTTTNDFEGYDGASWNSLTTGGSASPWTTSSNDIYYNSTGKVGIGTSSPSYELEVDGKIHASDGIHVLDRRNDGDITPINWPSKAVSTFFTDDIAGSSVTWDSGITVKGWDDGGNASNGYRVWQLFSNSSNMTDSEPSASADDLYFRSGVGNTWGTLQKVWTDGNFTPSNYLPLTGGTISGDVEIGNSSTSFELRVNDHKVFHEGTEIPGHVDLNDYRTTGFYIQTSNADTTSSGAANWPVNKAGILQVLNYEDGGTGTPHHTSQMYHQYATSNVWTRYYYDSGSGGGWTGWVNLNDDADFSSYLPLTGGTISGNLSVDGSAGIYTNGWFRNNHSDEGLYNEANGNHFYSSTSQYWHMTAKSDQTFGGLVFYKGHNDGTTPATNRKGSVYWSSAGFGFLDNDGSWAFRTVGNEAQLFYDGSEKLNTTSTGVNITGNLSVSGGFQGSFQNNPTVTTTSGYEAPGSEISHVVAPSGASIRGNSSETGAIKITLPHSWTNTMLYIKVRIYEYDDAGPGQSGQNVLYGNNSVEVHAAGYNHDGGGGQWVQTTAFTHKSGMSMKNVDYNVRFGHDGSKSCIYIGDSDTDWVYPQVAVIDGTFGYVGYDTEDWSTGWDVSFTTSIQNVDATIFTGKRVNFFKDLTIRTQGVNGTSVYGPSGTSPLNYTVANFADFKDSPYRYYEKIEVYSQNGLETILIDDLISANPTASTVFRIRYDDDELADDQMYFYFSGDDLILKQSSAPANTQYKIYRIDVVKG